MIKVSTMTQEERWKAKYDEIMAFMALNHRRPSKYYIEERNNWNWMRHQQKLMANDVIFFGHSINGMDFPYFKEYFQNMVSLPINSLVEKRITIITYDEQSAMQIKDNFRQNGIDVRSLFNKVELEFIMTKAIYEGNENEIRKLEMLKNKISGGEY